MASMSRLQHGKVRRHRCEYGADHVENDIEIRILQALLASSTITIRYFIPYGNYDIINGLGLFIMRVLI